MECKKIHCPEAEALNDELLASVSGGTADTEAEVIAETPKKTEEDVQMVESKVGALQVDL
ncbi:MAG: hypothetical protein J6K13_10685 [Clostridia bacterium]|nr:hypothetical protein [Clostridia bacterium]